MIDDLHLIADDVIQNISPPKGHGDEWTAQDFYNWRWNVMNTQLTWLSERTSLSTSILERLTSGVLNPKQITLTKLMMTKEQLDDLYTAINTAIFIDGKKVGIDSTSGLNGGIGVSRLVSYNKITLCLDVPTIGILEDVETIPWNSQLTDLIEETDKNTLATKQNADQLNNWKAILETAKPGLEQVKSILPLLKEVHPQIKELVEQHEEILNVGDLGSKDHEIAQTVSFSVLPIVSPLLILAMRLLYLRYGNGDAPVVPPALPEPPAPQQPAPQQGPQPGEDIEMGNIGHGPEPM